jgi:BirA family biotin operon repressor/biotin-[acetyl-CoA-carboxylase] ligase
MKKPFFKNIIFLEVIESTNTYLSENDFSENTIVYSFNQTSGRGRNYKKWTDFKNKNIACSFVLNDVDNNNVTWLIATSSIALIAVLKIFKIKNAWIKWPNDIYIEDKKIAGILAESKFVEGKLKKIIVGIGINVNCTKDDLSILDNKATSILVETDREIDIGDFFNKYRCFLEKWFYLLLIKKNVSKIKKIWFKYCKIINKKAKWINNGTTITGIIISIDNDGSIVFKQENDDKAIKINSGEISLV